MQTNDNSTRLDASEEVAAAARLSQIAELLDTPVETFFSASADHPLKGGAELMRLWCELDSDEKRLRALRFVRSLAES